MNATITTLPLVERGYARFDVADALQVSPSDGNYQALVAEYADLPADPYATEAGRYRRYGRGILNPWSREFSWIPNTCDSAGERTHGYYQGDHNPEYVNVVRRLPAIGDRALANPLLRDIILFDFDQTGWSDADLEWPLHVGVHLIKLSVADDDHEAISSPNELHQDGEPYVFSHLVYRSNALGGRNVIAAPRWRGRLPEDVPAEEIFADFVMTEPLQSYAIRDDAVSHYIGPIRKGSDQQPGERAVVLVDLVPMRQKLLHRQ